MIKNFDDIRYKKLSLRSEILIKETKIKSRLSKLKNNVNTLDLKNEIARSFINNPTPFINTAQISYDLVMKWKKARKQRKISKRNEK